MGQLAGKRIVAVRTRKSSESMEFGFEILEWWTGSIRVRKGSSYRGDSELTCIYSKESCLNLKLIISSLAFSSV